MEKNNTIEEKILSAALEVLSKRTLNGTRMHLIAKEAGMVQSNLHYYYKTKRDLLLALIKQIQSGANKRRRSITTQGKPNLEGKLSVFFNSKKHMILKEKKLDYAQFDFWVQAVVDKEINQAFCSSFDFWRDDIVRAIDMHMPTLKEDKKRILSYIMVSMMMGASMQYLIAENSFDLDEYFSVCMEMVLMQLENSERSENINQ